MLVAKNELKEKNNAINHMVKNMQKRDSVIELIAKEMYQSVPGLKEIWETYFIMEII